MLPYRLVGEHMSFFIFILFQVYSINMKDKANALPHGHFRPIKGKDYENGKRYERATRN